MNTSPVAVNSYGNKGWTKYGKEGHINQLLSTANEAPYPHLQVYTYTHKIHKGIQRISELINRQGLLTYFLLLDSYELDIV